MRVVIALGGDGPLRRGFMTRESQRANLRIACGALASMAATHRLVIARGKGSPIDLIGLQRRAGRLVAAGPKGAA